VTRKYDNGRVKSPASERGDMSEGITIGNRVEVSPATAGLFAGDVVAILAFIVAGVLQHAEPLTAANVADAAVPFIIGWLLAGAFFGMFATAMLRSVRETAIRTGVAWVVADLVGQGLRATPVFGGGFDPAFFVVSLIVGGVLLIGWRVVYVRFLK
jgi:hypothetical protein